LKKKTRKSKIEKKGKITKKYFCFQFKKKIEKNEKSNYIIVNKKNACKIQNFFKNF
jgi:hypothetical protein